MSKATKKKIRIKKDENFNNDDYVSTFFEQAKDDKGKIYGIPAYGTTQVLYYNKKAFENASLLPASITSPIVKVLPFTRLLARLFG